VCFGVKQVVEVLREEAGNDALQRCSNKEVPETDLIMTVSLMVNEIFPLCLRYSPRRKWKRVLCEMQGRPADGQPFRPAVETENMTTTLQGEIMVQRGDYLAEVLEADHAARGGSLTYSLEHMSKDDVHVPKKDNENWRLDGQKLVPYPRNT
jgi:hypothetical protein